MTRTFATVDAYIASQPEAVRGTLVRVRGAIRAALPGAEERIAYGMPSYRVAGRVVIHFAAWKAHYALYLGSANIAIAFRDDLRPYAVSKGTIRFPFGTAVPVKLITRITRFRAADRTDHRR